MFSSGRPKAERRRIAAAIAVALWLCGPTVGPAAVAISTAPAAAVTSVVLNEPSFSNPLVCDWNVDCSQAGVTAVVWSTDPFVLTKKIRTRFHASLRVAVVETVGPISVSIAQPEAVTGADGKATVTAVISGTGRIRFRTWVGAAESPELLPEGTYITIVHAESINK